MPEISDSELAFIYGQLMGIRSRIKNMKRRTLHSEKSGVSIVLSNIQQHLERFSIIREIKERYDVK